MQQDLDRLAEQMGDTIAADAIASSGDIKPEHASTKLGKQYVALRAKLATAEVAEEQKRQVFNHLYNFFGRYYEDAAIRQAPANCR